MGLTGVLWLFSLPLLAASLVIQPGTFDGFIETSGKLDSVRIENLTSSTQRACFCVHRTLYLMHSYPTKVRQAYAGSTTNMAVYFSNPSFYHSRLQNRLTACSRGRIYYHGVGRCNTERGTVAYVRTPFGIPGRTINICDEFFETASEYQGNILVREFARLEDIGDSPALDTDNAFVWDAIVGNLCADSTYQLITN